MSIDVRFLFTKEYAARFIIVSIYAVLCFFVSFLSLVVGLAWYNFTAEATGLVICGMILGRTLDIALPFNPVLVEPQANVFPTRTFENVWGETNEVQPEVETEPTPDQYLVERAWDSLKESNVVVPTTVSGPKLLHSKGFDFTFDFSKISFETGLKKKEQTPQLEESSENEEAEKLLGAPEPEVS